MTRKPQTTGVKIFRHPQLQEVTTSLGLLEPALSIKGRISDNNILMHHHMQLLFRQLPFTCRCVETSSTIGFSFQARLLLIYKPSPLLLLLTSKKGCFTPFNLQKPCHPQVFCNFKESLPPTVTTLCFI